MTTGNNAVFEISFMMRVVWDLHSLNNEGTVGNVTEPRTVVLADGRKTDGVSGEMLKHIHTFNVWLTEQDKTRFCPGCQRLQPQKADLPEYRATFKGKGNIEAMSAAIANCVLCDLHGFLMQAPAIARRSVVEFGWAIGIPDHWHRDTHIHARHAVGERMQQEERQQARAERRSQGEEEEVAAQIARVVREGRAEEPAPSEQIEAYAADPHVLLEPVADSVAVHVVPDLVAEVGEADRIATSRERQRYEHQVVRVETDDAQLPDPRGQRTGGRNRRLRNPRAVVGLAQRGAGVGGDVELLPLLVARRVGIDELAALRVDQLELDRRMPPHDGASVIVRRNSRLRPLGHHRGQRHEPRLGGERGTVGIVGVGRRFGDAREAELGGVVQVPIPDHHIGEGGRGGDVEEELPRAVVGAIEQRRPGIAVAVDERAEGHAVPAWVEGEAIALGRDRRDQPHQSGQDPHVGVDGAHLEAGEEVDIRVRVVDLNVEEVAERAGRAGAGEIARSDLDVPPGVVRHPIGVVVDQPPQRAGGGDVRLVAEPFGDQRQRALVAIRVGVEADPQLGYHGRERVDEVPIPQVGVELTGVVDPGFAVEQPEPEDVLAGRYGDGGAQRLKFEGPPVLARDREHAAIRIGAAGEDAEGAKRSRLGAVTADRAENGSSQQGQDAQHPTMARHGTALLASPVRRPVRPPPLGVGSAPATGRWLLSISRKRTRTASGKSVPSVPPGNGTVVVERREP
uniref:DevR family CRISPR-associated autoregulator n=1 Tax=Thermorudis sp. TaxID=1969470 RepID=A0A7C2ZYN4_9BACT